MINVTKTSLPSLKLYSRYLEKIWEKGWITNNGEYVQLLENELEKYLSIKNLIAVANGTLALQLAIKALDLKGEVITTPFTFAATTNSIIWEGLTPVFADINPLTFNIDPKDIEKKITNKTSAILAVHVYGNPCAVEELDKIAKKYKLKIIYDAAHAFGVTYKGQSILSFGDISTLSFHATKAFHTIEGGAVIVKVDQIFEKIKLMRNFGIKSEEEVVLPGINAKMNEFQAIMGLANLPLFGKGVDRRRKIYELYSTGLRNVNDIRFQDIKFSEGNYSYMPVIFKNKILRDKIYDELKKNGINSRKYFFPLASNFKFIKRGKPLPNSKSISNSVLCLPIYESLKLEIVQQIINLIKHQI